MTVVRVWAPRARHQVTAVVGADRRRAELRRVPCGPPSTAADDADGWWAADIAGLGHGDDYAFEIDGAGPFPDPRSVWQPAGVHGPSRLVDHERFEWHDQDWAGVDVRDGVIYELHVGTFSARGDFDGVVERLDHLVDLGVTAIELLPVNEFSGERNWGYDGVDLFAAHHAYGGPDGLKRLVDECHARGLAVVLDVVYNHLGPEGNYLGRFGPYFTGFYATPWGDAVNYDRADSHEVRRFAIDNALMWLRDFHVDGLRLDAVHAIIDTTATHLLEEIAVAVAELSAEIGRPLTVIAESDQNDPRLCRTRDRGGYGVHAQWSDDLHHALHSVLCGETDGYYEDFGSVAQLARALGHGWVYAGDWSEHRRRFHGRPPDGISGTHLLAYSQNHDQVGNRAIGDRLSSQLTEGQLQVAAALVLTSPFVPMLFQGEEWACTSPFQYFTDHQDPELGRAVAQGRRAEFVAFGWEPDEVPDPQDPVTFERSRLDWTQLGEPRHAAMLEWYRSLIALRLAHPDLGPGSLGTVVDHDDDARWLVVHRGALRVAVNLADAPSEVPCDPGEVLVASVPVERADEGAGLVLPAHSVAVVDTSA